MEKRIKKIIKWTLYCASWFIGGGLSYIIFINFHKCKDFILACAVVLVIFGAVTFCMTILPNMIAKRLHKKDKHHSGMDITKTEET